MTGVRALAVAGLGMGTGIDLAPGDVVVATAVVDLTVPAAPPVPCTCPDVLVGALTAALTSTGGKVRVRAGRVATAGHLVGAAEAHRLGAAGVLAVDLESAYVATLAGERPLAVVRVVVDTPAAPLTRPDVVLRGPVALVRLAAVGTALAQWAEALPPPAPASSAAPKETPR